MFGALMIAERTGKSTSGNAFGIWNENLEFRAVGFAHEFQIPDS
jgi:hypothetical protein